MENKLNLNEIVGKNIKNIYETEPYLIQEGIPGEALFFHIIIELDNSDFYELGAHDIKKWTKLDKLVAIKNDPDIIGQKIVKIILNNPIDNIDGSLILLLENNFAVKHIMTNGNQLCFEDYEEDINY